MQLEIRSLRKIQASTGFEPQCVANLGQPNTMRTMCYTLPLLTSSSTSWLTEALLRFRSGIFFFIGVINVHINSCIKLCPPLVRIYCSDCLQQKRPNQNLFFRHISRERGPTHHFCVTSNYHLIYSLKLD